MTCKEFARLTESYLCGKLPAEQQEEFELHYFECDSCFARLKAVERLYSKEVPIAVAVKKIGFEWTELWKWKPLMAAAAALLVVVFLSVFVIHYSNHMKLMYDVSTFSPPVFISSETRGNDTSETFTMAMQYYNQEDYVQALEILKGVPVASQTPQIIFFRGVCFLLVDELNEALNEFDSIIKDMNPSYYDEAIYYKAIVLLRMNKRQKAQEELKHLAEMFSPYASKARALIRKIHNI